MEIDIETTPLLEEGLNNWMQVQPFTTLFPPPEEELDNFMEVPPFITSFPPSDIVTLDVKDVYFKYQKHVKIGKGKTREQRIRNGSVKIQIQTMHQICGLSLSVKKASPGDESSSPVAFPKDAIKISQKGIYQHEAIVDLDAVYEEDPSSATRKPFYKLSTSPGEHKNKFKLIAHIEYVDGSISEIFFSKTFRLQTEKHPDDNPKIGTDCVKIGTIEASSATIGHLVVKDKFEAPQKKADIAYHLKLNDPSNSEKFEEGDVIGFFEHEGTGDTYIKRLTVENNDKIVHAGVISRSAFIEGNRSEEGDDDPTDTVCVLGIVSVKIDGSVRAGERVYASNAYPGKAVPQSHLLLGVGQNHEVLLGMALQSIMTTSLNEVSLARCFVCVMLGVSSSETQQEITELYQSQKMETKTEIKLASKRHWKRLCCCFSLLAVFLALLTLTIYQIFAPGSTLRYWICKHGCISGHEIIYVFSPVRDPLGTYEARGIEFTYEDLLEKTKPFRFPEFKKTTFNPQHDVTHYYLNVDRCAYGYLYGEVGNIFTGYRKIGGGKVFAVNWNCSVIYWAAENPVWSPYNISSTLRCWPDMPYFV